MSSYFFEDLEVGMQASHEKTVSESDITNFAGISGDFNPATWMRTMRAELSSNPALPTAC
jgi:acyl dehydratase